MNSPCIIQLLNEIGPSVRTAGGHYTAAQGSRATPILVAILSAVVAIGIAVTGWKLARHWRRRDNQRADLTDLAQVLRRIHVQIQLLADQDTVAIVTDCQTLRTLKYELVGSDATFAPEVTTAVADVVARLDVLLAAALPVTTGVGTATLAQARTQGRAVQEALAATVHAQAVISRLRDW
ncbi:hypothetical protein ACIBL8_21725 [Streptomyces sp. NPDC050523]|uniref:hypothetical protein n=1 Tax=Streptomyces sp. NPDC050523 TaxID=3365622 RepID=UPI0037A4F967